jgi:hypothetical protein
MAKNSICIIHQRFNIHETVDILCNSVLFRVRLCNAALCDTQPQTSLVFTELAESNSKFNTLRLS